MSTRASAQPAQHLSEETLRTIDARLIRQPQRSTRLTIAEGDTTLFEVEKIVPRSAIRGGSFDYEGIVTGIIAKPGIVVHPRLDSFAFEPRGPNSVALRLRYVMQVDPGTRAGGSVQFNVSLIERAGLANSIAKIPVRHVVKVERATPKPEDLLLDFWGYRHHAVEAQRLQKELNTAGIVVSIKTPTELPSLARAAPGAVAVAEQFIRARTRMWAAHRHLTSARQHRDAKVRGFADLLAANLTKPSSELPPEARLSEAGDRGSAREARGADRALDARAGAQAEPSDSSAAGAPRGPGRSTMPKASGTSGAVEPLSSYEPGSESDAPDELPPSTSPPPGRQESQEDAGQRSSPVPPRDASGSEPSTTPGVASAFDAPGRRKETIPGYARGLLLDDPNIAHGAAVRLTWASVQFRETAIASAFFFHGQVSLTQDIGAELTVPLEYVNLDVERARSVLALGNPLVAVKYRFNLPVVANRKPALTLRARWAVPMSPLHSIAPTRLGAEEFSREAHFTDTYAFFLEKSAIGLGASAAWSYDIVQFGGQLHLDYFFPVQSAPDRSNFLALHYGASLGVLPFGEIVGAYVEGRATTLVIGPRRTELFAYLGLRGQLVDHIEPCLFVGLPVGSVSRVTGLQFGLEIRGSYDVEALLEAPRSERKDADALMVR